MAKTSYVDRSTYKNRYEYLLLATVLQVFLVAFFPDSDNIILGGLTFTFFVLACINLIRHSRKIVIVMILFAISIIALVWVPDHTDLGQKFYGFERIISILFIVTVITQILIQILHSKNVNRNVIIGVINVYILFGLLAGDCNLLILHFNDAAFTGNIDISDPSDLRYFSFVTITTLGYGDISPLSQIARAAAVFFSLIAQIYLAVIIALIVGKFVSQSDKEEIHKDLNEGSGKS